MDDERQRYCLKPLPRELGSARRGGLRHLRPDRVREVDRCSLQDRAIAEHARPRKPTPLPLEGQSLESRDLVFLFEGSADLVLEIEQVLAYGVSDGVRHGWTKDIARRLSQQP